MNEHFLSDERDRIRHIDLAGDSILRKVDCPGMFEENLDVT
jgi:hypothetical protein